MSSVLSKNQFWLKTSLFHLDTAEGEILPMGLELAQWLVEQFTLLGYTPHIIQEQWGACVVLQTEPFILWINCSQINPKDFHLEEDNEDIFWNCSINKKISLFSSYFWKQLFRQENSQRYIQKINNDLNTIFNNEYYITVL